MKQEYRPEQTVYIDMDGVIADFDQGALTRLQQLKPEVRSDRPRRQFYLVDDYPEWEAELRQICAAPGFFEELPLQEGALEGWQRIIDAGFTPRILSSPLSSHAACEAEKRRWLRRHWGPAYGDTVASDALITKDKHLYDGIALIDDRPVIAGAEQASWSHIVMSRDYNRQVDTDLRLHDWQDQGLETLLELARQQYCRALGRAAL